MDKEDDKQDSHPANTQENPMALEQTVAMPTPTTTVERPKMEVIVPGKPRQVKALAMKALSAQKRAVFTNVCCIVLCPLLMVAFASILGRTILDLIQRSSPIKGKILIKFKRVSLLFKCTCDE